MTLNSMSLKLVFMTKTQVNKAMQNAGIVGELTGRGQTWEVEVADESAMRKFCRKVVQVGGFRTGYGAWVLRPGFVSNGDYNSTASRWHY